MIMEFSNDDDNLETDENDRKKRFLNIIEPYSGIWFRFSSYSFMWTSNIEIFDITQICVRIGHYVIEMMVKFQKNRKYDKFSKKHKNSYQNMKFMQKS